MKREKGKKKKSLIKGFLIGTFTVLVSGAAVYFLIPKLHVAFMYLLGISIDALSGTIILGAAVAGIILGCSSRGCIKVEKIDEDNLQDENVEEEEAGYAEENAKEVEQFRRSLLYVISSKKENEEESLSAEENPREMFEQEMNRYAYFFDGQSFDNFYVDTDDDEIIDDMSDHMDMGQVFNSSLPQHVKTRTKYRGKYQR